MSLTAHIEKWDGAKISDALASKSKGGDANADLLQVLEAAMDGKAQPKDIAGSLKAALDKAPELDLANKLPDLLWLVGESCVEAGTDEKKSTFKALIQQLLAAKVVEIEHLKERLSEEALQEAGVIKSAVELKQKIQRLRTGKVYSQQKYNLLREENEGYSKLIVELEQGGGDVDPKRLPDVVQALIAYFSLDPNRALDVILDCYEGRLVDGVHNVKGLTGVLGMFDHTSLVQVLGFKLNYYHTSRTKAPATLFRMAAQLIKSGHVSIKEIYPHLGGNDEEEAKSMEQHMSATLAAVKEFRVFNLKTLEKQGADATQTFNARPHSGDADDNHRLALLAALLEDGNWEVGKWLLDSLAPIFPAAHIDVAKALCTLARSSIAPLYDALPLDLRPSCIMARPEAPADMSIPKELVCETFDQMEHRLMQIMGSLSVYVYHDPVLVVRLCRIIRSERAQKASSSARAPEWLLNLGESLLGALALLPQNCPIASEIWLALSSFNYLDRYMIYSNVQWNTYNSHPELLLVRAQVKDDLRKLLKGMTKENATKAKRSLARFSHSNPLIVIETILDQVQEYQSMIEVCRDALAYSSALTLDIFSYMAVEELGGALLLEKPMLLDDYANLARWLLNLSDFISGVYVKYPKTEMKGMLVHILSRLQADSFGELEVLRQLINKMSGVEEAGGGAVSQEMLMAKAGGEVLRTSTETPWPLEQVFAAGDDPKTGAAAKIKAHQTLLKERKEAGECLVSALEQSGTGMSLLVVLGQQISGCMHTKASQETMAVKFTSWLHRQCHQTLLLLQEFLSRRIPSSTYISKMPELPKMVGSLKDGGLGLDPEVALMIMRPSIKLKLDASGKKIDTDLDLSQYAKDMHSEDMQAQLKLTSADLYSVFWSLSLEDIFVPEETYMMSIKRLKKALTDLDDPHKLNLKPKDVKRLRESLTADVGKLEAELKRQKESVKLVKQKLEADKDGWLSSLSPDQGVYTKGTPNAFFQLCILPRCVQSAEDAIFCAKFVKLLHSIKTPKLCTIVFYNHVICNFGPIIFSRTEHESSHLGRFLSETLDTLNAWSKSPEVYAKNAENYPGFLQSWTKANVLPFAKYQRLVRLWQNSLEGIFSNCLNVQEGVEVHNALTILSQLVGAGAFPIYDQQHSIIKTKLKPLTTEGTHKHGQSITVMAKSIYGRLVQCEDKMMKLNKKAPKAEAGGASADAKSGGDKGSSRVSDKKDKDGDDVEMKDKEVADRKRTRAEEDDRSSSSGPRQVRAKTDEASDSGRSLSKASKDDKLRDDKESRDREKVVDRKESKRKEEKKETGGSKKDDERKEERKEDKKDDKSDRKDSKRKEEKKDDKKEKESKKDDKEASSGGSKLEGRLATLMDSKSGRDSPSGDRGDRGSTRDAPSSRSTGQKESVSRSSKDAPSARDSGPKESRGSARDDDKRDAKRVRRDDAKPPPPPPLSETSSSSSRRDGRDDGDRRQGGGGAANNSSRESGRDAKASREARFAR